MESFSLKSCFVFCPSLQPKQEKPTEPDIQDAKLLLYYPKSVERSIQRSNIGIIEGTMSFLQKFDHNEDNQHLITELNSSFSIAKLFEGNIYLVLELEKRVIGLSQFNSLFNKNYWLQCLIDNVYDVFYLFHGDLNSNFFPNGTDIREDQSAYNYLTMKFNDFIVCYFEYFSGITTPFIDNILYANNSPYILNVIFSSLRLNENMSKVEKIAIAFKGRIIYNEIDISALRILFNLFYSTESQEKFNKFRAPPYKEVQRKENENDPEHCTYVPDDNGDDKLSPSSFLKAFDLNGADKGYLIGLRSVEESKYQIFIPQIHIQSLDEQYLLMVYSYKEICLFLLLSTDFNTNDVDSINQIAKNIQVFYGNILQKIDLSHQSFISKALASSFQYVYCNIDNHELHFSTLGQIWKSDKEKSKIIQNIYEMIYPFPPTFHESSVTKLRDNYVYYISQLEKSYVLILKEFVPKETIKQKYATEIEDKMFYV